MHMLQHLASSIMADKGGAPGANLAPDISLLDPPIPCQAAFTGPERYMPAQHKSRLRKRRIVGRSSRFHSFDPNGQLSKIAFVGSLEY